MGGLFSTPKQPEVKPPVAMPDKNDANIAAAKKKAMAAAANASGRSSTILTDYGVAKTNKETLG
jgi:hypothetical protein